MKRSVAPLSSRAFVARSSPVSRVCIDIGSSNEFVLGFEATIYRSGSRFSQFGRFRNRFRDVGGVGMALGSFEVSSVEEIEFDSCTSSTDNIAKRFTVDNGGIRFTRCPRQNPPITQSSRSPPVPSSRSRRGPQTPPARTPVALPSPCTGHRSAWGSTRVFGSCGREGMDALGAGGTYLEGFDGIAIGGAYRARGGGGFGSLVGSLRNMLLLVD